MSQEVIDRAADVIATMVTRDSEPAQDIASVLDQEGLLVKGVPHVDDDA